MNVASRAALDSRWLVSQRFDLLFVLLGGAALSAFCLVLALGPGFLLFALAFAVVLDFPHVMQTYVRVLLEPREAKLYGREFAWSLSLVAAAALYLYASGEMLFLVTVWIYWQPFHVIKQHLGIARIYNAKAAYRGPSMLPERTLWLGCVAPMVWRMAHIGFHFDEYVLFGHRLPFSGVTVPTPPVPPTVASLLYLAFAGCLVLAIAEQVQLARRGEPTYSIGAIANFAIAIVSYNVAYVYVTNLYATILVASAVHSLQYHTICWSYNHRRSAVTDADHSTGIASFLPALSRRQAVPLYVAFMLALGAVCGLGELFADGIVPLVAVLHHFYFDGIIWRGGKNADLKLGLGLADARPIPAAH
jgi:hypothetical protein